MTSKNVLVTEDNKGHFCDTTFLMLLGASNASDLYFLVMSTPSMVSPNMHVLFCSAHAFSCEH